MGSKIDQTAKKLCACCRYLEDLLSKLDPYDPIVTWVSLKIRWYPQFFEGWSSFSHHSMAIFCLFRSPPFSDTQTQNLPRWPIPSPPKYGTKASPGLAICCYLGQHCKPNRFTNKISKNIKEYQKISFQYVGLCWFQLMTPSTINQYWPSTTKKSLTINQ